MQTCIPPRVSDNSEGRYRNTDFKIIQPGFEMECPAGHRVRKETNNLYRTQLHWPAPLCNACSCKERCTRSKHGRIVSYYQGSYLANAQALVNSPVGKKLMRTRQILMEGAFGEASGDPLSCQFE